MSQILVVCPEFIYIISLPNLPHPQCSSRYKTRQRAELAWFTSYGYSRAMFPTCLEMTASLDISFRFVVWQRGCSGPGQGPLKTDTVLGGLSYTWSPGPHYTHYSEPTVLSSCCHSICSRWDHVALVTWPSLPWWAALSHSGGACAWLPIHTPHARWAQQDCANNFSFGLQPSHLYAGNNICAIGFIISVRQDNVHVLYDNIVVMEINNNSNSLGSRIILGNFMAFFL